MSRQLAILLIACYVFSVPARTQVYPFVSYTPRDGLVGNKVRFISQDSKGRLYFGTASGLSVYDGSRFTNYSAENGLYLNLVNDIKEAGDDSVLVILNAEKLQYIHSGKIGDIILKDSICPVINQWIKCSNGNDYALADNGLFRFEKDHFSKVVLKDLPGASVERNLSHATEIDSFLLINMEVFNPAFQSPRFLIAYNYFTGKSFTDTRLPDVYFSVKTPQNELLLATAKGIFILDKLALRNGVFKLLPPPKVYAIPANTVSGRLYFDRQQNLWISVAAGVLKIAPGSPASLFSMANGLPANIISCFFQDREGIMWFGNNETGVVKLVDQNLQFYKQLDSAFSVYDVSIPDGSDSVWMFDQVHNRILLDHQNHTTRYDGRSKDFLYRIAMGKRKFYASGPASIYQVHLAPNGTFTTSPLYSKPAADESFGTLLTDSAENIIAVGSSIVAVVNGKKIVRQPLDYLADNAFLTKDNFLVVITRSMNFYIYTIDPHNSDNYLQLYKRINWKDHNIEPRSFDMDDSGNLWIGSRRNGLFGYTFKNGEIKLSQQLTVKNGLTENFIKYVHCDGANRIWAGSPTGLDRISFEGKNVLIENVTKASNMYLDIWKVASNHAGVVWAVTTSGLVKVYPSSDASPRTSPEIILSRFTVNSDDITLFQKEISLKSFQNNLSFHVAVPSFFDEKKTLFSYKLDAEGKKGAWTEPASQPDMSFLNLAPGRYHLNIRAVFLNGKYDPVESSYSFLINPPWWQTWWFRLMAILLLFLMIFIFFRQYYRAQLQKQLINLEKNQLIEKERSRIAIDMHDDMGAGLSRIKVLSETIKFENQKGIVNPLHLQKISSYSEEMMDKMGEIVWALNQQNDSIDDLLGYTRAYAVDYLTSHNINCVFHAPAEHNEIFVSGEMRRNIFLSVKEVLHNVVKHAEATRVDITINLGKQLFILIQDNGKGIDPGKMRKFGNGLNNISKRMADIGGTASFKNENGTLVSLHVQLD